MATIRPYDTAKGKRYRVRYRKPDGSQTDKRGFVTKDAAKAFANEVEVNIRRGEYVSPSAGRATIGDLGPDWLDRQRGHMKRSGFRSLESAWRVQVQPRWNNTQIGQIRFTEVQAWVAELSSQRGATIVLTAHGVLARILDDAVKDRLIHSNPARGVKLPRKVAKRNVYLSHRQAHELAAEAGRYRALVLDACLHRPAVG